MSQDLLIELGTEELPPTALANLSSHFSEHIQHQLDELGLNYTQLKSYASPRRLGLLISNLDQQQADKIIERKGPNVKAAYDADGNPTKAAEGFARSCKVSFDQLTTVETEKGTCLAYSFSQKGQDVHKIIPELIQASLDKLPIPKRMRWGSLDVQFVRPVHWLIVLYGEEVIDCEILSVQSSNVTYGHRFHHPQSILISRPNEYEDKLLKQGFVIANYEQRKQIIVDQVKKVAAKANGCAVISDDLLDEVTGMVEWPQAVLGSFDAEFLEIPKEALISSMKKHQKYFHLFPENNNDDLLPLFITISNIQSLDESQVREGNERVIRPRLADSMFFWNKDCETPIQTHLDGLANVIFQQKLGSLKDKTDRIITLNTELAKQLSINVDEAIEAASLCKADLMSEMVGEFPDLQGIMGRYYAEKRGSSTNVSLALDEHYLPRFSGDKTSQNSLAQALAICDRIDTLCGIFAIGSQPTGDKDPFALRRAALGLLRIIVENKLDIDLADLISKASSQYSDSLYSSLSRQDSNQQVLTFILDRFKGYLLENKHYSSNIFESVRIIGITHPVDFIKRMDAVVSFSQLIEADSLSAANKRITNILKKADKDIKHSIVPSLFTIDAELLLHNAFNEIDDSLTSSFTANNYSAYLEALSSLKQPIDQFFEDVMVFDDDLSLRHNRISLLSVIHQRFTSIADISLL